ncbi:MAG TPA: TonB-dependent receptor [Xanthomonadaceae bacterium]|nr:TonB-dependent receptor [Xanthomonadaceae bacterium]
MTLLPRARLACAIQLSLLIAIPGLAAAQDAAPSDPNTLDRVQVTGSRIKRAEVEGQVPVQVVTREDIDRTGLTSIADVVQALTASGSALNTKFNSSGNFGFPPDGSGVGAGSAQVDLRHLGSKRVLVLVDGIRWVNEASASGVGASTDLNTIPLAIVERIEVLEDGASALYGSDAIAGVVNIITKKRADGVSLSVQYGQYEPGDGETMNADLSWGTSTEHSSLFVGASFVEQKTIFSRDRELSSFPRPGGNLAFGSGFIPNGQFFFRDPNTGATQRLVTNTGITNPVYNPAETGCVRTDSFHCFTNADRFNFSQFNLLLTPSKRAGIFGQYRFDISETTNFYVKALYNRRESTNQAAPEPIQLGPASGNTFANTAVVSRLNPFNPFGFDLISQGPNRNITFFGRRPVEGGPRVFEQEVNTVYVGAGLEGTFGAGERIYSWDVNVAGSDNRAEQTNFGSYNIRRIVEALGDPARCAQIPGCTPLNIFGGPGAITPAMLAFIQPVVHDESENQLRLVSANITGDLFNLPAGPLSFASGVEHRRYSGSYQPDPITVAGEYNGVPSLPTRGEYDVSEVYTEFNVPLLADSGFAKKLDLSIAGRYSDYSTFGGNFTGKVGLRWQMVDELLFRATFAEGFRAPSIGELFGSASRFDAQLRDPCLTQPSGAPPTGSAQNCAGLGVPAGAVQINPQISVSTGGNPDLQPEEADSFTAGAVWTPTILENTAISRRVDLGVTFYRHKVEGAVQAIDAQTQLNLCVQTTDPVFCSGISRAPTGAINQFNNFLTNIGVIETDGWDFDLGWSFPDSALGQFRLDWRSTWVGRYDAFGANGVRQPRTVGVEVNDSAIPEFTSTAILAWERGPWNASWTARHISDLTEACPSPLLACSNPGRNNRLGAVTYHDAQVSWNTEWMRGLELTLGANNIFGKEPPPCLTCSLNGYDASTYDVHGGGFYYVRAGLKF